jgi:asparagine synthase (glutamine-hydrolysing)
VNAVPLTGLEVACGLVLGDAEPLPRVAAAETPLRALEDAILPALRRAPCLVSFSGGRDSSAVLATATHLARREGLPLPIPATHRFPNVASTHETEWQEQVVRHLELDEWVRLELSDELDCIGPVAQRLLRRHGLLWPCNAHFHGPLLDAAAGGSLLTGIGGDEVLGGSRWGYSHRLLRRGPRRPRDVFALAYSLAPRAVRRAISARRPTPSLPWLKAEAAAELHVELSRDAVDEPFAPAASVRWRARRRYLEVGAYNLGLIAADVDATIVHPLLDARFVASLAAVPWRRRPQSRSQAMRLVFGSLLPDELISRPTKAHFDGTFWNTPSREFAARWDGGGLDETVVDADAVRREWASETPNPRTFTLLQSVWLARDGSAAEGEQALAGVG